MGRATHESLCINAVVSGISVFILSQLYEQGVKIDFLVIYAENKEKHHCSPKLFKSLLSFDAS